MASISISSVDISSHLALLFHIYNRDFFTFDGATASWLKQSSLHVLFECLLIKLLHSRTVYQYVATFMENMCTYIYDIHTYVQIRVANIFSLVQSF